MSETSGNLFSVKDERAGEDFSGRVKDVFAALGSGLVKCTNAEMRSGREEKPDFERQQMERSGGAREEKRGRAAFRDEEDEGFKRPKVSVARGRGRGGGGGGGGGGGRRNRPEPGWKKNPEGYTKYSLADVPEMSQSSNTAAAFDFLNKLKKDQEEAEIPADLSQKIVFKKRHPKQKTADDADSTEAPALEKSGPAEGRVEPKKKKKTSRPTLSFNEDEEDE